MSDWAEATCWLALIVLVILCVGDPDLIDALVSRLMEDPR